MKNSKKILFVGPMGAGKTTAISTISDVPPVRTEAKSTSLSASKETTTIALDYGSIQLGDEELVHLYGVPGQERFQFVWPLVSKGAMGGFLLVNCEENNWLSRMMFYIDRFCLLVPKGRLILALNRADSKSVMACTAALREKNIGMPVILMDPRSQSDVVSALELLITQIEMESMLQ